MYLILCYIAVAKMKTKKCKNELKVTRLCFVCFCSPDADGMVAEALLTFWFSATDCKEALRKRVERILWRGLKKYTGPLRIDVRSSTVSSKDITSLLNLVIVLF